MLGAGTRESIEQIGSGLNRMDYTQKEVYAEIKYGTIFIKDVG